MIKFEPGLSWEIIIFLCYLRTVLWKQQQNNGLLYEVGRHLVSRSFLLLLSLGLIIAPFFLWWRHDSGRWHGFFLQMCITCVIWWDVFQVTLFTRDVHAFEESRKVALYNVFLSIYDGMCEKNATDSLILRWVWDPVYHELKLNITRCIVPSTKT